MIVPARIDERPLTQEELAEWFAQPIQLRSRENELWVEVSFFRHGGGGTIKRVHPAGPSASVPVTGAVDGFDWDMGRTFLLTPVPLYVNWDEWCEWLNERKKEGQE